MKTPVSTAQSPPKQQFTGIDLLRFFSTIMVLFTHLSFQIGANHPGETIELLAGKISYPAFAPITRQGWVGVEIFFVISGFVIAFTANGTTAFHFFRSRFLRLVPMVWLCATITVTLLIAAHLTPLRHAISLYIRSILFYPKAYWIDIPYWTLSIEVFFYALVFLLICRNRLIWIGWVMGSIGVISSLIWMGVFLSNFTTPSASLAWYKYFNNGYYHIFQLTFGANFAVGVLMWLMLLQGYTAARISLFLFCFLGSLCEIDCHSHICCEQEGWYRLLPTMVWVAGMIFMMFSIRFNSILHKFCPQFFRTIGLMTFPVYLLHCTLGLWLVNVFVHGGADSLSALFLAIFCILLLSWLMMKVIEPTVRPLFQIPLDALENFLKNSPSVSFLFKKCQSMVRTDL